MAKVKYYYDSDTLSYRKIDHKKGKKIKIFLMSIFGMLLSGFLLLIIYLNIPYIVSPKEKVLKIIKDNPEDALKELLETVVFLKINFLILIKNS